MTMSPKDVQYIIYVTDYLYHNNIKHNKTVKVPEVYSGAILSSIGEPFYLLVNSLNKTTL